jgi:hypothetical protein
MAVTCSLAPTQATIAKGWAVGVTVGRVCRVVVTVPLLTEFSCTKPKGKVAEVCLNVQIQWACDVLNTLGWSCTKRRLLC